MSRSYRAWAESCALVRAVVGGAVMLGGPEEVRVLLGHERLLGTARSFIRLRWLAAAVVLVLACGPAVSLGRVSGSGHGRAVATHVPLGSALAHAARSVAGGSRRSPARGRSAGGGVVGARLLASGSGEGSRGGSGPVRVLQRRLAELGFAPGPVDGRYGPLTEQAVMRLQAADGLRVDGIAGSETLAAVAARVVVLYPGAGYEPGGSGAVRVLQRRLAELGFAPGLVDGRYGPGTERAVGRLQAARGLRVDGIADASTLAGLGAQTRSRQRPGRRSRPVRVSLPSAHKPAGSAVRGEGVVHASGSAGVSVLGWLLVAAALVLGLVVIVVGRGMRRRGGGGWVRSPQPQAEQAVLANGARQTDPAAQDGHVVVAQGAAAAGSPPGCSRRRRN